MKISRSCKLTELNWAALPDLKSRIEQLGAKLTRVEVTLSRSPDSITYNSLQDAADAVRQHDAPHGYSIGIFGSDGFYLTIDRGFSSRGKEFLFVTLHHGALESKTLDHLTEFLGLSPREPRPTELRKTAFIAHRFDDHGDECAKKVTRFLELLGFVVVTGRTFSPRPVPEKVRGRISEQDLLFVILTPGTDNTWLTQEPIVGESKDKPLFLLKQRDFDYKAGLLGDREYITFSREAVETTFIPILEGLHDLGYDI